MDNKETFSYFSPLIYSKLLPETKHRLQHLEHWTVVGHVQDKLDLFLLLKLRTRSIIRSINIHNTLLTLQYSVHTYSSFGDFTQYFKNYFF